MIHFARPRSVRGYAPRHIADSAWLYAVCSEGACLLIDRPLLAL